MMTESGRCGLKFTAWEGGEQKVFTVMADQDSHSEQVTPIYSQDRKEKDSFR